MHQKLHKFAKKGLALLLSSALILGCAPCMETSVSRAAENKKEEAEQKAKWDKDVDALRFSFRDVSSNLKLPTAGKYGSTITWTSSNESVIKADGTVTRPEAGKPDVDVTLEATISLGNNSQKKSFSFTVLAQSSFEDLQAFQLNETAVTDSYYLSAQNSDIEFLKKFDNDRLLSRFRETAGLDQKGKQPYNGWENSNLGGHCVGHYLSACAQAIKTTGDETLKAKLEDLISGLNECQQKLGTGFLFGAIVHNKNNVEQQFDILEGKVTSSEVWVPWYNMHKMLTGLVDTYRYTGNEEALDTASRLGDWIYNRVNSWDSGMQAKVLGTEYGGMNDCLYDLYFYTNNDNHLKAAQKFEEPNLYKTVTNGKSNTLKGRHANTTIPKFVGALKRYTVMKAKGTVTATDKAYLEYAEKFWDLVVNKYSYITGGVSVMEHFRDEEKLDGTRTKTNCESCCAHNMLKLSKELFQLTGDKKYADYYETTLRNSIMAAVRPENGAAAYFIPMSTGYFKTFGNPDPANNMFWCCTGSGMENFTKLGDSIYFHNADALIVNQYVASRVTWAEKNLEITQTSDVTKSDTATLSIHLTGDTDTQNASIALRVPDWIHGSPVVKVNGTTVSDTKISGGYICISRDWKEKDELSIQYPMTVTAAGLPDNGTVFGFRYGPTVLAAKLGKEKMTQTTWAGRDLTAPLFKVVGPESARISINYGDSEADTPLPTETLTIQNKVSLDDFVAHIDEYLVRDSSSDSLVFKMTGTDANDLLKQDLTFVPFNTLNDERYGIYWYLENSSHVTDESELLEQKDKGRFSASIVDSIQPGYSQYEKDAIHQLTEDKSTASTIENGGSTRHAKPGGYFSYNMIVNKDKPNSILCQFAKADNNKTIKISVGTTVIAEKKLSYTGVDAFYKEYFQIPADVLKNNVKTITVANNDGSSTQYTVVPVRFESATASSSARLVGGLYMTVDYSTNASLTSITCSNGQVRQTNDQYTIYLPAGTESTTLKYNLADRFGLLCIDDSFVNDTKALEYTLNSDKTTFTIQVYAEDHKTIKTFTIQILRGVEVPPEPTPDVNKPIIKVDPPVVKPPVTPKKKKASIRITGKKTVKKGKSITLKAKLTNVSGKVKWSVNKKKLAKIKSKGKNKAKLKALKKGKIKVTAKIKKVKKTITIRIK